MIIIVIVTVKDGSPDTCIGGLHLIDGYPVREPKHSKVVLKMCASC